MSVKAFESEVLVLGRGSNDLKKISSSSPGYQSDERSTYRSNEEENLFKAF